jgi:iron complex outermembrane receptor protein
LAIGLLMGSGAHAQAGQTTSPQAGSPGAAQEEDRPAVPTPVIDENDAAPSLDTIIVTGSAIRGVAPVGSNLVSVGLEAIEKTAPVNVSQLVNTVPSISTAGSMAQGENVWSGYSPQIHSLAGSSSNTTLTIADGLRLPGAGIQFSQTDPNIIPVSAIQRVEVLADGASSVYGSDAVAGVVNFITRDTFDGFDINVQAGFADDYDTFQTSAIWGTTWDTGGVYVAGSYAEQSALMQADRPFLSRGDYRDVGGSVNQSFQCAPATIRANTVNGVFLSPSDTTAVANLPENAPCNNSIYGANLPATMRANALVKVTNDFSDRFNVTATMNYNRNETSSVAGPGGVNNATVFGPGSGREGQVNPFYINPAGAPTATQQIVSFLVPREDGEYGRTDTQSDTIYATLVAEYELTDDWSVRFSDAFGWNRSASNGINTFCQPCALLALNGTAQLSGSTTATNVPGQNVIALNLPLTAGNALDVWSAPGQARTSETVAQSLYRNNSENANYNTFNQVKVDFQGSLFDLPGGALRLAVGGEYFWQEQTQRITAPNNTGPTTTGSGFRVYNYDRDVKSFYGELYIPVISPEMGIPFAHSIDLSISGRYDSYNDVGDTTNPKFAANWEPVEGLKFRGNYSESFVAPPIAVIGDPTQGYLYSSGSVGVNGARISVPIANYPEVTQIPGIVCNDLTCEIGTPAIQGMRRQLGGGFSNMTPQFGKSWSVGVDFAPIAIPGLTASGTFFHNTFDGGVSSPSPTAIVTSAGLRPLLTLCPTGCTNEQILTFANVANGATVSGAIPEDVFFLIDQSSRNALNLELEGIDAQFAYRTEDWGFGQFTIGTALTYFTKYDQNFGGGTSFSILNTSGYNTTFPSVQFKNRAQLGWEYQGAAVDLFWNHTGSYRNWMTNSVTPIEVDEVGNPIGGGDKVDANDTFDLHVQYTFESTNFLNGWQVFVDIQNVFDTEPPFYNGNTGGFMGGAWGYNGFVSSPIGRLTALGLRATF